MFFQKHYELFSETLQCFFKNTATKKNNKKNDGLSRFILHTKDKKPDSPSII